MPHIIALGCNCHPAYWLKKCGIQPIAYPFDLLDSPAHLGIQYCLDNINSDFSLCLDSLSHNDEGRCISKHYPRTVLFHHENLLSADPELAQEEKIKLERRIDRFKKSIDNQAITFLYCYLLDEDSRKESSLNIFDISVNQLLNKLPLSNLIVYFKENDHDSGFTWKPKTLHQRVTIRKYIRNTVVDKIWGECPDFFNDLK